MKPLRIVAGIALLLGAVINGCSGTGYYALGVGAEKGDTFFKDLARFSQAGATPEQSAAIEDKVNKGTEQMHIASPILKAHGLLCLVLLAFEIVGGILLLWRKAQKAVIAIGALAIAGEVGGVLLSIRVGDAAPVGAFTFFGFVVAGLAIFAATQYPNEHRLPQT